MLEAGCFACLLNHASSNIILWSITLLMVLIICLSLTTGSLLSLVYLNQSFRCNWKEC